MADKVAKRGVSIFIDGKEVKNSVAGITNEMRKLQGEQKKMTIGSDDYIAHAKKIEYLRSIHAEHLQNQRKIAAEYGNMSKAADKSVKSTEGGFSRMANGFNKYFAIFTAGLATITGLAFGLKKFMDMRNELEDSSANLKSLTGLGDKDIDWLKQYAKELSTTTTEAGIKITASSKEIMDGFTTIGSKRPELLKNKEAMAAVTKEALTLAAAGKMDVATAFDVVTASMNQFNLGADQSKRIINAIAAGSLEGSAEADSLAGSLKNVGTVASSSNMSLEDTVAMLEVLASKQLVGEEAGTKLRGAILKLKDAGIGYTSGAFNMRDALVELNQQMDKKTGASQKDALMQKIFGAENITAGQILLDNVATYDKLRVAVTGTNTAYEQAKIQTNTVSATLAQAQNRFSELGMELVKNMNPAMLKFTNLGNTLMKMLVNLPTFLNENKLGIIAFTAGLSAYVIAINAGNIATKAKLALSILDIKYDYEKITAMRIRIASEGATTAADYIRIAAMRVRIAVTGQATIAELRLIATQKALNASMMTNIYFAAAAAIAAISYGVYKLATHTTDAQKAMHEFNKEAQTQTRELNNIFEAYKKANPKSAEKAKLLQIIKDKYGPYIKGLIDERGNLINVEKAQKMANNALRQSIALKIKNKYIDEYASVEIENQATQLTKIRERIKDEKGESLADLIVGQIGETMTKNINDPMIKGLPAIQQILNKYGLMSGVLDRREFGAMTASLASSYYKIGQKTKEFDAVFKGLIGDAETLATVTDTTITPDTPTTDNPVITPEVTPEVKFDKDKFLAENKQLAKELSDAAISDLDYVLQMQREIADQQLAGKKLSLKEEYDLKLKSLAEDKKLELDKADLSVETAEEIGKKKKLIEQKYRTLSAEEKVKYDEKVAAYEKSTQTKYLQDKLAIAANDLDATFALEKIMREQAMDEELALVEKGSKEEKAIKDKYRKLEEDAELALLSKKQEKIVEYANMGLNVANSLNSFVTALDERELADFEKKNKGKIGFEEEYAKKKAKMEYDAAVRAKAIAAMTTIVNTSQAVMTALAAVNPIPGGNVPFAIAAGVEGALQLATILAAPLPQLWTGGFTGNGGKYEPKGVVHGGEFVSNMDAVSNPNLQPVHNLINEAQKAGTVSRLKKSDIFRALGSSNDKPVRRNSPSGSGGSVPGNNDSYIAAHLAKTDKTIKRLADILDDGIEARSIVSGQNGSYKMTKKYERYVKNASR